MKEVVGGCGGGGGGGGVRVLLCGLVCVGLGWLGFVFVCVCLWW